MRVEDVIECWAANESTALEALLAGFQNSIECHTIVMGTTPIAIFGLTAPTQGPRPQEDALDEELPEDSFPLIGYVWLLGTPQIEEIPSTFIRWSREWLDHLSQDYDAVMNYVYAKNHVHVRWLQWLGCEFVALHADKGLHGEPFYEFVRITA